MKRDTVEDGCGKGHVEGTAGQANLHVSGGKIKGNTKAGSKPLRTNIAVTLAMLDINVKTVPTTLNFTLTSGGFTKRP